MRALQAGDERPRGTGGEGFVHSPAEPMSSPAGTADVLVVGGGPGGSTAAWALALRGLDVLVLERARFPREKVCGDYVDPRGLRVLQAMGCLGELERAGAFPISRTATHVDWRREFHGPVPFYGVRDGLPAHGCTIPRQTLDAAMLEAAAGAGATVHDETAITELQAGAGGVEALATSGGASRRYRARVVVGADGVNSVVARSQGLGGHDRRRTVVARRAYATGATEDPAGDGAEVFFDRASFPGYSWVFPLGSGRVNLGVGVLSEARDRAGVRMPELLDRFVSDLRERHPGCGALELEAKPIGGVVCTYGGAGPNHFDGGVLVGDAGSFVDPMTGEGITQAMESALLAVPALLDALERGADRAVLAAYEVAFRSYFDPSMLFLAFCAEMLRNRHLRRPWLKALARGCQVAQADGDFARTSGSYFGGLEIRPLDIIGQVWQRSLVDLLLAWPRFLAGERVNVTTPGDLLQWQVSLGSSLLSDPGWHIGWTLDVERAWSRLLAVAAAEEGDPRLAGPPLLR